MVTFTPTPIGNLDDISKRALLALQNAEIIFCEDTRVTKKLLNLLNIPLNKEFISMHSHNEDKVLSKIDPQTLKSKEVVYVSDAGMPAISDPGSKLVKFCQKHDIPYTVIPGANAALTAFVASGFEGEFCFHAFLPHKGNERNEKLKEIINSNKIAILYESPHRIEKLLNELKELIPDREIFLAKELTKIHETYIKGKAKDIELKNTKGEWVVVIDKGENKKTLELSYDEISALPIPPKEKSKLLAKISEKSAKEIYKELINQ
ncbi:16S rRNA (cytidine(1402)-2'-O)-methyltransferase [Caminibacter pacificus]|uniref:Ribosomal RNA small subunit methyltransferase I n=1 Tax=Caminibacter pacificus TaxID=1424653 RepID=A0AAJ4UXF3_9BACT|nr:16S rRNA (cytidine(1402)-2'-O)-methyltransferase [Caminibacter pacificus]NPA87688.1 16S rRNA (cytidine(1402)-2'-O)-methyltransferase [Campylobacterota bacterium]QCI28806.1 16S rRNA (cytidine(1402)-2'-O)-methyltransferase [Caminibacter pacificus]ROR39394.1 16S rRNA (cytidine1402-2'-O)-methyltransferase [Caminibacter pacificus]